MCQCGSRYSLVMHKLTKDKIVRAAWIQAILKGRKDLKSEKDIPKNLCMLNIHFRNGKLTKNNPVQYQSYF